MSHLLVREVNMSSILRAQKQVPPMVGGRKKSVLPSLPTASVFPLQAHQMFVNQPITSVTSRLHRAYHYERTATKYIRAAVNLYICMIEMLS
jgi:hypothetical protein